jgi:hypothetical protein
MGRWITDGEQSLAATRTTSRGKAGDHCKNAGNACDYRNRVTMLADRPASDGQTNEHGCEEKQTLPSWQLLRGAIAHG